jgi:hypothetical protein
MNEATLRVLLRLCTTLGLEALALSTPTSPAAMAHQEEPA